MSKNHEEQGDPDALAGQGCDQADPAGDMIISRHKPQSAAARAAEEQRKARAARTLKENLLRRKQQQRARRAGEADEGVGLPAAKTTHRDD